MPQFAKPDVDRMSMDVPKKGKLVNSLGIDYRLERAKKAQVISIL